jgi:hypothetical protein
MYATMMFLYYYLAKQEENICLQKYGDSYQVYYEKTGMFFPKLFKIRQPDLSSLLPRSGAKRITAIMAIFVLYISSIAGLGFLLKDYALSNTTILYNDHEAVVSVAPLKKDAVEKALAIAASSSKIQAERLGVKQEKRLIYVLPSEWGIPELGIKRKGEQHNYLLHPETHGNSLKFNGNKITVLFTSPILNSQKDIKGKNILKKALSFIPYLEIEVDLQKEMIISKKMRENRGKWDGIPVPIY